jgi:hypothetical protein
VAISRGIAGRATLTYNACVATPNCLLYLAGRVFNDGRPLRRMGRMLARRAASLDRAACGVCGSRFRRGGCARKPPSLAE